MNKYKRKLFTRQVKFNQNHKNIHRTKKQKFNLRDWTPERGGIVERNRKHQFTLIDGESTIKFPGKLKNSRQANAPKSDREAEL